jgi:hypothetical protein
MTDRKQLYKKRIEGVKPSQDLKDLLSQALGDLDLAPSAIQSEPLDNTRTAARATSPTGTRIESLTTDQAKEVLKAWNDTNTVATAKWIPIPVVRAMQVLLDPTAQEKLEQCLHKNTALVFTPATAANPTNDQQQIKLQKRREKLMLRQEEYKYHKLTRNLGGLTAPADDVTTKSMTYAASIGLNMIVAPISFGAFMYFFAGGVMDFLWNNNNNNNDRKQPQHISLSNGPDIKRVIIGVISGVVSTYSRL